MCVQTEQIHLDTNVQADLNATSMDVVTIAAALSDEFSLDFDIGALPDGGVTVGWIVDEILQQNTST